MNIENESIQINNIPKFTTAHELLEDKFSIEIGNKNKSNNNRIIELAIGGKICFVKPHSDLVCDTIVKGLFYLKNLVVWSLLMYMF